MLIRALNSADLRRETWCRSSRQTIPGRYFSKVPEIKKVFSAQQIQIGITLGQRFAGTPTVVHMKAGLCCEMCPGERGTLRFVLIQAVCSDPGMALCQLET